MKNISTGAGLVMLGLGIALHPLVSGLAARATAAPSPPTSAAAAVASVAAAQTGPTVVLYQAVCVAPAYSPQSQSDNLARTVLFRAWSDGTIEARQIYDKYGWVDCADGGSPFLELGYCPGWKVISSPTQGYKAAADINADELVDGIDLASILGNWGDAPRVPFPPSDCPLNLINP